MIKLADLQWIAGQVDDLAVLLRVHGMEELAGQFEAARDSLHAVCIDPPPSAERTAA